LEAKPNVVGNLAGLGAVASGPGQGERAARLLGAAEAMQAAIGSDMDADVRILYEQAIASARAPLGEDRFEKAMQEGRAMSLEQAIQYAREDRAGE
jgi:hypothetical protein